MGLFTLLLPFLNALLHSDEGHEEPSEQELEIEESTELAEHKVVVFGREFSFQNFIDAQVQHFVGPAEARTPCVRAPFRVRAQCASFSSSCLPLSASSS